MIERSYSTRGPDNEKPGALSLADYEHPCFDGPDMLRRVKVLTIRMSLSLFGRRFWLRVERDCMQPNDGRVFVQIVYTSPCGKTGQEKEWHGRKWYLSDFMTDDEIVKTVYAAFELSVRHEVMEGFKLDGVSLFNPHLNFEELIKIANMEVARAVVKKALTTPA